MAKVIYTVKIVLFREKLTEVFDKIDLDHLKKLATFLVLVYVPYWFCCTTGNDALIQDLRILAQLEDAMKQDEMAEFCHCSMQQTAKPLMVPQ